MTGIYKPGFCNYAHTQTPLKTLLVSWSESAKGWLNKQGINKIKPDLKDKNESNFSLPALEQETFPVLGNWVFVEDWGLQH